MHCAFRVDASMQLGSGHVMRCLTLAQAWRERGHASVFICREEPGHLAGLIQAKGFPVALLPGGEFDWATDAAQTCAVLKPGRIAPTQPPPAGEEPGSPPILRKLRTRGWGRAYADWLVVDHYGLDHRWEAALRPLARRILVIDDLADRRHDCDALLDQNLSRDFETRYDGLVPPGCRKLLGPRFALLRPEFGAARQHLRQRDGVVRRIFIFFGGSDATDETSKALAALRLLGRDDIAVDVVVGAQNPHRDAVEALCRQRPNTVFHCQVSNMAELMAHSDLALGAGGVATWERCALGLPSLIIIVAENQRPGAEAVAEAGAAWNLGDAGQVSATTLAQTLARALEAPAALRRMSAAARQIMGDGDSTAAVVDVLEECDAAP